MTQIHIALQRVNPALDIDLAHVGDIEDGQFSPLSPDIFQGTPIFDYFVVSHVSRSPYVSHQSISSLVAILASYPNFAVEFFDNTLVLTFDFNIDCDEIASKEESKGN